MPLTPADVHNVAFSKPPIGKRGYNEDEVDQFLDLVEDTLAQLQDDNDDLRARVEDGGAPAAGGVDKAALRKEIEAKLRGEYETKLSEARKATEKAEAEAKAAKTELQKAKADADKARSEAEAAKKQQPATAVAAVPASSQASGAASADTHMQAAKVLGLAQEMADRLTSEAQAESKSMLDEARSAAEGQLSDADTKAKAQLSDADSKAKAQLAEAAKRADQQIAEADNKAKALLADAEKRAEETTNQANSRAEAQIRQAEEKANALQADAERKHTEIMATVKQQQTALETRISELRVYEREYRTRLKTLLQSQLDELESRGSAAPNADAGKQN